MILSIIFPWGLYSQNGKKDPVPAINRPAVEHPFIFAWGAEFKKIRGDIKQGVRRETPGLLLEFNKNGVQYKYSFFRKLQLKQVLLKKKEIEGTPRMVLDKVIFSDQEDPQKGRLFAVTADFPSLLFEGKPRDELLNTLKSAYGAARPAAGNILELENRSSRVLIFFTKQRDKTYLYRISFISKVLSRERNEFRERLDKNTTRKIKEEVAKANRELKDSLRKQSGK